MPQQQTKGAKGSKGGRAKAKMAARRANKTTQKHKILRVFESQGYSEAMEYAHRHLLSGWAEKRLEHLRAKIVPDSKEDVERRQLMASVRSASKMLVVNPR